MSAEEVLPKSSAEDANGSLVRFAATVERQDRLSASEILLLCASLGALALVIFAGVGSMTGLG